MFNKREYYKHLLSSTRWQRTRLDALVRALCRCQDCGRAQASEVHHVKPVEHATSSREMERLCYDPANLVALCHDCHQRRHIGSHSAEERSRQVDAFIEARTRSLFD